MCMWGDDRWGDGTFQSSGKKKDCLEIGLAGDMVWWISAEIGKSVRKPENAVVTTDVGCSVQENGLCSRHRDRDRSGGYADDVFLSSLFLLKNIQ